MLVGPLNFVAERRPGAQGSILALLKLYQASVKALLRMLRMCLLRNLYARGPLTLRAERRRGARADPQAAGSDAVYYIRLD